MEPGTRRDRPTTAGRGLAPGDSPDVIESGHRSRVLSLLREAWQRQRCRRALTVGAALVAAAVAVAAWSAGWPGAAGGGLHVGDLATGPQRVVARISADTSVPLVSAGGRIYWVDPGGGYLRGYGYWPDVVRSLDLATGRIRAIAPGQAVLASADGRHVFIAWTGTDLIEVPADDSGPVRRLTVPRGWFVAGNGGIIGGIIGGGGCDLGAVGDGILVQASEYQDIRQRPTALGVWNPAGRAVRVLGRMGSGDYGLIGAVTPPARHAGRTGGLVAWVPAGCGGGAGSRCLRVTDLATGSSVTVPAPTRYGFAIGGALSADGRWLAAFAITGLGGRHSGPSAQLVVVNTASGAAAPVPGTRLAIGAATLWAVALPGRGGRDAFLGGYVGGGYLFSPGTLTARPVRFRPSGGGGPNFSTAAVPPGRHA